MSPLEAAENPSSREEIDVHDKASIERWSRALGTTDAALMNAVQAVGTRVDRIKDYLAAGRAGEQQDA